MNENELKSNRKKIYKYFNILSDDTSNINENNLLEEDLNPSDDNIVMLCILKQRSSLFDGDINNIIEKYDLNTNIINETVDDYNKHLLVFFENKSKDIDENDNTRTDISKSFILSKINQNSELIDESQLLKFIFSEESIDIVNLFDVDNDNENITIIPITSIINYYIKNNRKNIEYKIFEQLLFEKEILLKKIIYNNDFFYIINPEKNNIL